MTAMGAPQYSKRMSPHRQRPVVTLVFSEPMSSLLAVAPNPCTALRRKPSINGLPLAGDPSSSISGEYRAEMSNEEKSGPLGKRPPFAQAGHLCSREPLNFLL